MTFSQHGNKDTNHKTLLVLDEREKGEKDRPLFGPKKKKEAGQEKGDRISSLISPASFG